MTTTTTRRNCSAISCDSNGCICPARRHSWSRVLPTEQSGHEPWVGTRTLPVNSSVTSSRMPNLSEPVWTSPVIPPPFIHFARLFRSPNEKSMSMSLAGGREWFKDKRQSFPCLFLPHASRPHIRGPRPSWLLQSGFPQEAARFLRQRSPEAPEARPPSPGSAKLYAFHASRNINHDLVTPSQKGPIGFGEADDDFIGKAINHNYEIMKRLSVCPCLIAAS